MKDYQFLPGISKVFNSGLKGTTIDGSLHTSSNIGVAKQSTTPTSHLNPTIFGQPIEKFTLESVKAILSMFKKQGSIRKTSTLETLLPKIIDLESKVALDDQFIVTHLLASGQPLTRSNLFMGVKYCDDSGEEVFIGENRTCQICYERAACIFHGDHSLCTDCVKAYMVAACESRAWQNITCPICPEKIEAYNVLKYLSGDLQLRNIPGFSWCLSPTCRSGQVHTPGDESPMMICQKCGFATCYSHQLPWHHGRTCEQVGGLKSKEDRDSEAWIKSQTKACPGCGVATVKNGGCDGVFCQCGRSWNWKSNN